MDGFQRHFASTHFCVSITPYVLSVFILINSTLGFWLWRSRRNSPSASVAPLLPFSPLSLCQPGCALFRHDITGWRNHILSLPEDEPVCISVVCIPIFTSFKSKNVCMRTQYSTFALSYTARSQCVSQMLVVVAAVVVKKETQYMPSMSLLWGTANHTFPFVKNKINQYNFLYGLK